MLTAIAAFAEAFVNPLVPLLALVGAAVLRDRRVLRAGAVAVGMLLALLENVGQGAANLLFVPSVLGAVAAAVLHLEIVLHLVLPALRWLYRCMLAVFEIGRLLLVAVFRLGSVAARDGGKPPGAA